MHFLPDVYVPCEVCHGARYNRETLEITYRASRSPTCSTCRSPRRSTFFERQPAILRHIQSLADVGLGYVRLGQPAPTLSGGEAQRVKLATELAAARPATPLRARRADHRPALRGRPRCSRCCTGWSTRATRCS
jgi:excinuclease UvrABC ATPase subunit